MRWQPSTEIQFLKGVGPKYAEILRKKGIFTFKDLYEFYPRAYLDQAVNKPISDLQEGDLVTLKLRVLSVQKQRMGKFKSLTTIVFTDGTQNLHGKFFKAPFRGYFNQFEPESQVMVTGKVKNYRNQKEIHHPQIIFVKEEEEVMPETGDGIVPVYSESESLNQRKIIALVSKLFDLIGQERKESLTDFDRTWNFSAVPPYLKKKYKLMENWEAHKQLHFPDDATQLKDLNEHTTRAHLTLIFEEFFSLELLLALKKKQINQQKVTPYSDIQSCLTQFQEKLPFELTNDQLTTLKDISNDFASGKPMHRLVQGDVGSGKTLVAFAAAYIAAQNNQQVAFMAPTEILAKQHYKNAKKLFQDLNIPVLLITGKQNTADRETSLTELSQMKRGIVVGTHALFEEKINFNKLGLVIVDEQHRFGVHQRKRLKQKGSSPHFLVMTATPIPRTLTMTVYGDLDFSLIKELPPGRSPIKTQFKFQKNRQEVLDEIKTKLALGEQAYFVFPLVSESESLDLKSAEHEYEELSKHFSDYEVALLHGRMRGEEKEETMERFRKNEAQVLVSTTVIEVGVDVPNATVMVIENSERFGLSQLHQLRGRVGRGQKQGHCYLILGNKFSQESLHRAKIMASTTDGFKIAEEDLNLRGPGEILGSKQSGLPTFKLADLMKHRKVLAEAKQAAFEFVGAPEHERQLKEIVEINREKFDLKEIG